MPPVPGLRQLKSAIKKTQKVNNMTNEQKKQERRRFGLPSNSSNKNLQNALNAEVRRQRREIIRQRRLEHVEANEEVENENNPRIKFNNKTKRRIVENNERVNQVGEYANVEEAIHGNRNEKYRRGRLASPAMLGPHDPRRRGAAGMYVGPPANGPNYNVPHGPRIEGPRARNVAGAGAAALERGLMEGRPHEEIADLVRGAQEEAARVGLNENRLGPARAAAAAEELNRVYPDYLSQNAQGMPRVAQGTARSLLSPSSLAEMAARAPQPQVAAPPQPQAPPPQPPQGPGIMRRLAGAIGAFTFGAQQPAVRRPLASPANPINLDSFLAPEALPNPSPSSSSSSSSSFLGGNKTRHYKKSKSKSKSRVKRHRRE
jgi:hypothetical protein